MRFRLPPVFDAADDIRFALERIELFLNKAIGDIESDSRWTNQRYPRGPETTLKIIRGRIAGATGTVLKGTGFSLVRHAVGQYTLDWTPDFSDVPAVVAMGTQICYENANTAASTRIHTFTDAGVAADSTFNFIAIGPE